MISGDGRDIIGIAQGYADGGWAPIPIPARSKAPIIDGWQRLRLDAMGVAERFGAKAKAGSSRAKKFVTQHGRDVFELEALDPAEMQSIVRAAIDSVIDINLFNAEVTQEREDSAFLAGVRKTVLDALKTCDLGEIQDSEFGEAQS